jgi:hypothetical protein
VDAILLNLQGVKRKGAEEEFLRYLEEHPGTHERIAPVRYRLACWPLLAVMEPRDFMIESLGGEVVHLGPGGDPP